MSLRPRRQGIGLALLAVAMFGFGFALVPLYGLYCQLTGTPRAGAVAVGAAEAAPVQERYVTVRFDTTVQGDLPWEFVPGVRRLRVKVGETSEVQFHVRNRTGQTIRAQAVPAVAPWQATPHFAKTECFCFNQQTLAGGEERDMPLRFVVRRELPESVDTLTLSYTFMRLADTPGRAP